MRQKKHRIRRRYVPFYLAPVAISLALLGPDFVRVTMYSDGVWYAAIARNLADGIGTFWYPHLSRTIFPSFHEHPPLMFGLQAFFFEVLGGRVVTEKVYNLLIFLVSWWLIARLWRFACHEAGPSVEQAETANLWFIPVMLWLLNEATYTFYPNNLLEGTLTGFDLGAVLCLLRATKPRLRRTDRWLVALAGTLILAAFFTKGPVGLFPLAFFFLYWLLFREISFPRMLRRTLLLLAVTAGGLGLLLLDPAARDSLGRYFDTQVLASISAERTNFHFFTSCFYILLRLFILLLPALLLTGAAWAWFSYGRHLRVTGGFLRWSLLFLAIGLSASLPLAVSLKQGVYYLLPSIPFYALGLGLLVAEGAARILAGVRLEGRPFRTGRWMAWALVLAAAFFAFAHFGETARRDRPVWNDAQQVGSIVPAGATLGLPPPKDYQAALVGYLQRYHRINVDTANLDHPFRLLEQRRDTAPVAGYRRVEMEMEYFQLYERE